MPPSRWEKRLECLKGVGWEVVDWRNVAEGWNECRPQVNGKMKTVFHKVQGPTWLAEKLLYFLEDSVAWSV